MPRLRRQLEPQHAPVDPTGKAAGVVTVCGANLNRIPLPSEPRTDFAKPVSADPPAPRSPAPLTVT
jgi:hypothetical protein